ncbi:hypothetical protein [Arthrobacter sp. UYCo732]|uniref:hypothetical protein n=1 Tax=Arthrobacter sp. UYCo732 TaxID=3156336 RepID=UPI0033960425
MKKTITSVLAIPDIELKHHFWLDHGYLGGVDYRFGWKAAEDIRSCVVVFRGDASTNHKPVRGPEMRWQK